MTYKEFKENLQSEVNALPIKFAFSNKQLEEICQEWGFSISEASEKLYSFGHGGFYLKDDSKRINDFFNRPSELHNFMIKSSEFAKEAFIYELANHEYYISRDYTDTLEALDLTHEKIIQLGLEKSFLEATKEYLIEARNW